MELITATYTQDHRRAIITFMDDGTAEFSTLGEFSDEELERLAAAEGCDIQGWHLHLS